MVLEIAFMESACIKTAITHIEFMKNAFLKTALHCAIKTALLKTALSRAFFITSIQSNCHTI